MAIYDKPVRLLMKEMAAEMNLASDTVFTRQEAVSWFKKHYPKIKEGTITAHLIRLSTNAPSRLHYNAKSDDNVFFQVDGSRFRLFAPANDPEPISEAASSPDASDVEDESDSVGSTEFAYEADLKNYLIKNLDSLEPGLKLFEEDGITGIEFPVGGRFIDILAIDSQGDFVVIELKVSKGYDRVVGQLMRYMAWIEKNQAERDQGVRGMIVARKISTDLIMACSLVNRVQLFEYELSLKVDEVLR